MAKPKPAADAPAPWRPGGQRLSAEQLERRAFAQAAVLALQELQQRPDPPARELARRALDKLRFDFPVRAS